MEKTDSHSPCDYVMKARDNQPKPLTREMFQTLLDDMNVRFLCDKVREHKPDAERYKTMLPAITWQSRFGGKLRTDQNASPSGLFCIDVDIQHEPEFKDIAQRDGIEAAFTWAEREAQERALRWARMQKEEDSELTNLDLNIVAIHISPSATGVHVVAQCYAPCKSIAENQSRLARLLGTSYDEVCKDWARIYFVTPREDWTYLDLDHIFGYED